MTRGSRASIFALVTLCGVWVAGCSSNPSGVNTQNPPSATATTVAAPTSSASAAGLTASEAPPTSSPVLSTPATPTAEPLTSTGSPTPLSTSTPPSPKTTAPADPEAADRSAIEAVWAKYWITVKGLAKVPAGDRLAVMKTVAVAALAATVVSQTANEEAAGRAEYGVITHRPYWASPVGGKPTAVMNDCMNDYNAGTLEVKTGKPVRAGVYRDNTRATFFKGTDGLWRAAKIEFLVNISC